MSIAKKGAQTVRVWEAVKGPFECVSCGREMILKRGAIRRHHFAHKGSAPGESKCNKGEWHVEWQSGFDDVEVTMGSNRADIVSKGFVIEIQDSYISAEEIRNREHAYGENMMWIFNFTERMCQVDVWAKDKSGKRYAWLNVGRTEFQKFTERRTFYDTPYGLAERIFGDAFMIHSDVDSFARETLGAVRDIGDKEAYHGYDGHHEYQIERLRKSFRYKNEVEGFTYNAFFNYYWYGPVDEWMTQKLGELQTFAMLGCVNTYMCVRGAASFKYKDAIKKMFDCAWSKESKCWVLRAGARATLKRYFILRDTKAEHVRIEYFPGASTVSCTLCEDDDMRDFEYYTHFAEECPQTIHVYDLCGEYAAVGGTFREKHKFVEAGARAHFEEYFYWTYDKKNEIDSTCAITHSDSFLTRNAFIEFLRGESFARKRNDSGVGCDDYQ